jgi:hypothetical protein
LAFVIEPQATIGSASRWTNEMSAAFLSLTSQGDLSSQQQAKQADADQLFDVLVYQPWVVLEFGGVEHCVATGTSNSASVQPLTAQESQALANGTEIQVGGRTCIDNANKYASHFLRYSPDDNDRTSEYTALEKGDSGDLPSSDPSKADGSYKLGPADEPAADAMGKGGQYQRLLLAIVIFAGECGAFLLLGVLSVAVILAQVILLLLLAFAPVALVIAVFPGRGHEFFLSWLTRLATFLLRKAVYSLILAVLLAVAAALDSASADLGWLMSFGLEATFFWAVFLYRRELTSRLSLATTGYAGREGQALRLATLYALTRNLRYRAGGNQPPPPPPGGEGNSGGTGRGGSSPQPGSPGSPLGDAPQPSGDPQTPPTIETTSPTTAGSETASAHSTTRDDMPVAYTSASETTHGQSIAQSTTPDAAGSAIATPQYRSVESARSAHVEPSETRASTNTGEPPPSKRSAPASSDATPNDTGYTPIRPPSSHADQPQPHDTQDSRTRPDTRRESDQPSANPSASAAATMPSEQHTPVPSSLAESLRQDLRRLAPPAVPTPDRAPTPAIQARPVPSSTRTHPTAETQVNTERPTSRPDGDLPVRTDERKSR